MTLKGRRVVFVLQSFRLGGAERQAVGLARYLAENEGADVTLVGLSAPDGAVAGECERHGLACEIVPFRLHGKLHKFAPGLLRLGYRLRRLRCEVLVPFLNVANVACGLLWQPVGARASIWNQRDQGWSWTDRPLVRRAIERTPFFVANSRGGTEFLVSTGVDADRVRALPNAVELAPPAMPLEAWRNRLGAGSGDPVVVMVAHLHHRKDHTTLLEAWRAVLNRRNHDRRNQDRISEDSPRAILALAGSPGDSFDHCAELAGSLGIGDSVRFLGEVRDVSGLLHASDIGVLSSHHEGCPNAVLEYMAAGLPVLGTDIPSIREVLKHDEFLVPVQDVGAWADRIVAWLADEGMRRRVGERNRDLAATEYGPRRQFQGWAELIAEALRGSTVTPF